MGKFEKLVILTVLFAAAIVLAISFNRGDKKIEAGSPLSGAQELLGEEPGLATPEKESKPVATEGLTPADAASASLLLNAGDEPAPEAPEFGLTSEPVADRNARILADTTGLRPSFLEEYMVYTIAEGDTWSSLAQRFFQDGRFTRNLHQANDGMATLTPGGELLVPVYDFVQAEAGLQAGDVANATLEPQPLDAEASTPSFLPAESNPAAEAPVASTPAPVGSTLEYVVVSGDTLSGIALAALGSSKKWPELLELNKDKLPKPEALKVGMKLKLPAGAKLPSASAKPVAKSAPKTSAPKASESKPTAKKDPAPEAAPKKKKKVL